MKIALHNYFFGDGGGGGGFSFMFTSFTFDLVYFHYPRIFCTRMS